MHLSDFDLQQLNKARLSELTVSQKEALLEKALEDLKEVRPGAHTPPRYNFVSNEWARKWPSEEIWLARRN